MPKELTDKEHRIAENKKYWVKRKEVLIPRLQVKIDRLKKSGDSAEVKKLEKWLAENK